MYNSRRRIDVLMTGLVDRQDWGQNWYISSELLGGKVSYELPGKVGVHSFCWIGYYIILACLCIHPIYLHSTTLAQELTSVREPTLDEQHIL